MAGHSKWSNIKRKKKIKDEKKSKFFSKLSCDIKNSIDNEKKSFKKILSKAFNNNLNKNIINKIIKKKEEENYIFDFYIFSLDFKYFFLLECKFIKKNSIISDLNSLFYDFGGNMLDVKFIYKIFNRYYKIFLKNYNEEYVLFLLKSFNIKKIIDDSFICDYNDFNLLKKKLDKFNIFFSYSFYFFPKKTLYLKKKNLDILKKKILKKEYIINFYSNIVGF